VQPRAMVSEAGNETRAIALSSGLGRSALVFDDDDVVHLLRAAVEREGSQIAFAKHHGINRTYLNMVLSGKRPVGDAGSWASQNIRRRVTEAVRRSVRCLVQIGRVPCRGYWSSQVMTLATLADVHDLMLHLPDEHRKRTRAALPYSTSFTGRATVACGALCLRPDRA